jgi:hypothetical protein
MYMSAIHSSIVCRKKLKKGVLLHIHLNLCIALLLALVLFVAGIETATVNSVRSKDKVAVDGTKCRDAVHFMGMGRWVHYHYMQQIGHYKKGFRG